ncbi:MAG: MarC family protein [Vicinamibacterales bacterium]|nr:MarC family protein [Vicinamibacterales bacterium]
MDPFTRSFLMLFVLLNPFIMTTYLEDLVKEMTFRDFAGQLIRAGVISFGVFVLFAWGGDRVFENVLQIRFFAFLIFGGLTFLIIGIRLISGLSPGGVGRRPDANGAAASIAMPFLVGPGTISASVLAGSRLPLPQATIAIGLALTAALAAILVLKRVHDLLRTHNEPLLHRYTDVAGRVTALFTGSFAIDMILRGFEGWIAFLRT